MVKAKKHSRRANLLRVVALFSILGFSFLFFNKKTQSEGHHLTEARPSSQALSTSDTSEAYTKALRASLTYLKRHTVPVQAATFRRILIRERVGLRWDTIPEKYWEHNVINRVEQQVSIVDIGANVGQFAIPNAARGHIVHSFEPNPNTCRTLKLRVFEENVQSKV